MQTENLETLIESKNYTEVGNVFTRALPDGAAIEFLEKVIESLNGGLSHKKSKSSTAEVASVAPKDVKTSYILNDAVDEVSVTLAVQIPEDMNLIAYIIGAKGINVMNLGKSSGTKIQVEKVNTRGPDQYRHIFIMGTLKNVLRAFKALQDHILRKDAAFPDITRMIVPNEVVAHIIGKGGVLIKELSTIACCQRIDIQQEIEMNRMTNGFYGRSVIISGDFSKRLHVVYLLLRQLTQDNSLPQPWKGDALPVLFPQGWSQPNQGQNMGNNMGNNMANNMYPKLPGQGGFPQGGGMGYQGAPQGGGQGLFYPNPREPSNPPPRGPVYANTIKVDVQVPSDKACLGHIIGPKGLFIVEMERSSQCTIKIEKEFVEGTNPAERKVSVSGSNMVQISQALDLVNNKVDEWRRNYTTGGAGSYRAPDEPKPYWDAPKAASGFGAYPNQYPAQYTPQGPNPSQPSYAAGGAAQTYPNQSTAGTSQYSPSQAVGQSQYVPAQGGLPGGNMQMPGQSQSQGGSYYQGRQ